MWWYYNDAIFPQIPTETPHSLLVIQGLLWVQKSDLCSGAVIAVLYVIAWYIGPRYNAIDCITIEVSFVIQLCTIWFY